MYLVTKHKSRLFAVWLILIFIKISMFEYPDVIKHCTSYDEMESLYHYNPSEVIIIHNLEDKLINNIINFASIKTECIHKINVNETNTCQISK